ncbi:MAG: hypothetical protein R3C58_08175 [Parvularculaceae bacterium]
MLDALLFLGDSDVVENWEENALLVLARLKAEIAHYGGDERLEAYAERFARHPRLASADAPDFSQAVIYSHLRLDGRRLSLFSTLAQFGSVQEVNASDIRIELMFPADDETRRHFEGLRN